MKQNAILRNIEKKTAEVDLSKNQILVVKDGQVIPVDPPASGYGEQVAIWLGGRLDRIDCKESKKL